MHAFAIRPLFVPLGPGFITGDFPDYLAGISAITGMVTQASGHRAIVELQPANEAALELLAACPAANDAPDSTETPPPPAPVDTPTASVTRLKPKLQVVR